MSILKLMAEYSHLREQLDKDGPYSRTDHEFAYLAKEILASKIEARLERGDLAVALTPVEAKAAAQYMRLVTHKTLEGVFNVQRQKQADRARNPQERVSVTSADGCKQIREESNKARWSQNLARGLQSD